MLARVNDNYYGIFGLYNTDTNSSVPKTRKSAPFEVDDALFQRFNAQGILVKAGDEIDIPASQETVETVGQPTAEESGDDDIFSRMTYKELCAEAKKLGIRAVGVSTEKIIEALREAASDTDETDEPFFEAEEPV